MQYNFLPWIGGFLLGSVALISSEVHATPAPRPASGASSRPAPRVSSRRVSQPQPGKSVVKRQRRVLRRKRPPTRRPGLWQDVQEFWSPKVRFVWRANREFWGSAVRGSQKFWGSKVRFVWRASREFWIPKVEFMVKANREFWGPLITDEYLPYVRDQFRFLKFNYGRRISRVYAHVMQRLKPVLKDFPELLFRYSYHTLPKTWKFSLQNVPASVKKAFDSYFSWSLRHLPKSSRMHGKLPKHLRQSMTQLSQAMVFSQDRRLIRRLQRVFFKVKRFAEDHNMHSCYRVIALQSEVMNAFNTGCTTYVTSALARQLTDLELAAVMAHELSHGDQGHAVKNLGLLSKSVGEHLYLLMSEEVEWFLSGRIGPTLQRVLRQGNLTPILHTFGKKAPAVEVAADQGGTRILLKARISPQHLITALMKLHGKDPSDSLKKDLKNIQALRHYPSLYRRVQAIRQTWTQWRRQHAKTRKATEKHKATKSQQKPAHRR